MFVKNGNCYGSIHFSDNAVITCWLPLGGEEGITMYDRVKVAQEERAKKTEQAKAESVLMNLLSLSFKDLYYFWEFDFGSTSNAATIGEVLEAFEKQYKR